MKPSELMLRIDKLYNSGRAGMIWGAPGIGKSQLVYAYAKSRGLELVEERMGDKDPVDVKGLPRIENDTTFWTKPEFMPTKGKGILFLDEINVAPKLVQAACYQLINQRRIGRHPLPKDWAVIAAGNRETDRAVVHKMSSALSSRFIHLDFDVDLNDWVQWALTADVAVEIIAFLRFRPNLLHAFDPKKDERSYPCPRTWEYASDVFKLDHVVDYEMLSGTVGEGAATEFAAFTSVWKSLPDIDAMLLDPASAKIGDDPAVLYAVCGALTKKANSQNMARIVKLADKLPEEFSVLLMRDIKRKDDTLIQNKAYITWVTNHQEALGLAS